MLKHVTLFRLLRTSVARLLVLTMLSWLGRMLRIVGSLHIVTLWCVAPSALVVVLKDVQGSGSWTPCLVTTYGTRARLILWGGPIPMTMD